jgi:hypothetical protein
MLEVVAAVRYLRVFETVVVLGMVEVVAAEMAQLQVIIIIKKKKKSSRRFC